jgi:hypothetical protein
MKRNLGRGKKSDIMERKETAVWLGRSMSTHEITMRMVLQLLDVVTIQQQVVQALYEKTQGEIDGGPPLEALEQLEQGLSDDILQRLTEIRGQITPVLQVVDDSCQTLEKML